MLCSVTTTGVTRPASLPAQSATRFAWLSDDTRTRGRSRCRYSASERMLRRTRAAFEVDQADTRRDLVEQRSGRGGEHEIHGQTALGDALRQVEDDTLGTPTLEAGKIERDRPALRLAHAQSNSCPSQRYSSRLWGSK